MPFTKVEFHDIEDRCSFRWRLRSLRIAFGMSRRLLHAAWHGKGFAMVATCGYARHERPSTAVAHSSIYELFDMAARINQQAYDTWKLWDAQQPRAFIKGYFQR